MLSEESVLTTADKLFPGQENFSLQEVMSIVNEAASNIFNSKLRPNSRMYKRFIRFLFAKNMSNLDTMILLTAMKGGGKSSTAIQFAREWCHILGISWDPKKYIAYTNADLVRKIDTLPPWSPLIADESVRFITSDSWNKRENKELKKKLAQIREKHFLFILCFPLKIKKVEKTYLESFVNYWIELYARGKGAVFARDSNPYTDSWRLDDFKKIGAYSEFTTDEIVQQKLREHPNFWKFMNIPKVPEPIYQRYKKIREANVYRDNDEVFKSLTKEDIYKSALLLALNDVMTQDHKLNLGSILLHIKNHYDISIPKNDVKDLISDAVKMMTTVRENGMS